jgi:coenzyme F420 hydrogenase subunit beta
MSVEIKNIDKIFAKGLCSQCGTCISLCPKDNIKITRNNYRDYIFKVRNPEFCKGCGICHKVCPGHSLDFEKLNDQVFGKTPDNNLIGYYKKCYLTQSNDDIIRTRGASGGTVTDLLDYGISENIIDGALVVSNQSYDPIEPKVFIARNREDIISASQSKYCPVPMNVGLKEIMKTPGRYAVVGLPCHIHGIRKAEQIFPSLKERIKLKIGLLCGPGPGFTMIDHLLKRNYIEREHVAELKYREGYKWPGKMMIRLKSGKKVFIELKNYLYAQTIFNRYRCSVCMDFACEYADISFGDAHLPEFWRGETYKADNGDTLHGEDGWNLTISRTDFGEELLNRAEKARRIKTYEIYADKAIESQRSMIKYKKHTVFALFKLLRIMKKEYPEYKGVGNIDNKEINDYIKSLIVIVSNYFSRSKIGFNLLSKIPEKILTYKFKFRQRKIEDYIKPGNRVKSDSEEENHIDEKKENVRKYFSSRAHVYRKNRYKRSEGNIDSYLYTKRKRYILDMLDKKGGRVLDIGCGPGILTKSLLKRGYEVWGLDMSENMIAEALGTVLGSEYYDKAHFMVGNAEELNFQAEYFDYVICSGVIPYINNPKKALSEVSRVLKKDGKAIITVPTKRNFLITCKRILISILGKFKLLSKFGFKKYFRMHKYTYIRYRPWELDSLTRECNLKKTGCIYFHFIIFPLYLIFPGISVYLLKKIEDHLVHSKLLGWLGKQYIMKVEKC